MRTTSCDSMMNMGDFKMNKVALMTGIPGMQIGIETKKGQMVRIYE